jgi:hypothetical protein
MIEDFAQDRLNRDIMSRKEHNFKMMDIDICKFRKLHAHSLNFSSAFKG